MSILQKNQNIQSAATGSAGGSKPGMPCLPSVMPEIQQVVTVNVKDVSGLVQREVDAVLASLPLKRIECVTVAHAAELLKCSADTIRGYIRKGDICAVKVGNDYRIRILDFENFLQANMTNAIVRRMQVKRKKVC